MAHYLYLEVEGIQRFVFASPKLKIIRGGSALLDVFNRVDMPDAARARRGEVVLAAGGHCLVRGLSLTDAEDLARGLERTLRNRTDGQVSLSWGIASEGNTWNAVWGELHDDLARRALDPRPAPPPLPPFVALCSSCGISPARALEDIQDRELKPLCQACIQRLVEAQKIQELARKTIWTRLRPHLGSHEHKGNDGAFQRLLPEREFEELADSGSGGAKWLAYLYCDGNGMGKELRKVKSAEEYGSLSKLVDEALHKAVGNAIRLYCPPDRSKGKFGAEVLLLGGDDLMVALPADRGAVFTQQVLEVFFHETGGMFRLSAGLVFAPFTTPVTILQRAAAALLRGAKRYAYLDDVRQALGRNVIANKQSRSPRKPAHGYIDFQELTSSQMDIERRHSVTCRPYRLDDFVTLVQRTQELRKAKVPQSRLHALVEAVRGSEREARTMTQLIVGRARKDVAYDQQSALLGLLRPLHQADGPVCMLPYTTNLNAAWDLPFDLYPDEGAEPHRWSIIPDAVELVDHLDTDGESI